MRVRLPLFGGSFESQPLNFPLPQYQNYEHTYNMLPQADPSGKEGAILMSMPGLDEYATVKSAGNKNARAMALVADPSTAYVQTIATLINDQFAYTASASTTLPGTITTATDNALGPATLVNFQDGAASTAVWAPSRVGQTEVGTYNFTTDVQDVTACIGSNFANDNPKTIAYLNRQIIGEDGQSWASSAPGSQAIDTTTRLAEAESFPDRIVRIFVLQPYLYIFGTRSTEIWRHTGTGKPPFQRIPNGVLEFGLANGSAINAYNDTIYFIDNNHNPMMMQGTKVTPLANSYVASVLQGFFLGASHSTVMPIDYNGNLMVIFNFKYFLSTSNTSGYTFVWHKSLNTWTQLTEDSVPVDQGTPWPYSHYVFIDGSHIFLHDTNGKMYDWVYTVATEGTGPTRTMTRERQTQPMHSGLIPDAPSGRYVYYDRIILTTTPGIKSGGSNVDMSYSDDGGNNFSTPVSATLGAQNAFETEVYWNGLGRSRNRTYRFTYTDTEHIAFISLDAEVTIGSD